MSIGDRVQSFTRGEEIVVDVAAIERDLAALWRQASQNNSSAVTRACLWNLVFHVEDEELFTKSKTLIDAISPAVPARVLVLRPEPNGEGQELEAWISANCHIAPGGGKLLCSEEVTITGRKAGVDHFPGVVRALLVPDVPVTFYWVGPPPSDLRLVRPLIAGVNRLLVDSADLSQPEQVRLLAQFGAMVSATTDVADLNWLRLSPYRYLLASMFDQPVGADPIVTARRITIEVTQQSGVSALLLFGWMSGRLNWGKPRRVAARRWAVPRMGGEVTLEVVYKESGDRLRDGISSIEIESADKKLFSLRRTDADHVETSAPGLGTRVLPASTHKDPELTVAALGVRGHDPLYARALQRAGEIERAAEALR